jgi:hypothetical protein
MRQLNLEMSSVMSHGQLQVPPGLPSALESLARAVLKEQEGNHRGLTALCLSILSID